MNNYIDNSSFKLKNYDLIKSIKSEGDKKYNNNFNNSYLNKKNSSKKNNSYRNGSSQNESKKNIRNKSNHPNNNISNSNNKFNDNSILLRKKKSGNNIYNSDYLIEYNQKNLSNLFDDNSTIKNNNILSKKKTSNNSNLKSIPKRKESTNSKLSKETIKSKKKEIDNLFNSALFSNPRKNIYKNINSNSPEINSYNKITSLNKFPIQKKKSYNEELLNNLIKKNIISYNNINKILSTQNRNYKNSNNNNNDININENNSNNINDINSTLKKITNSLIGLQNLGNTCYMNTCLQNLIHCKPLIKGLLSNKKVKKKKISNSFLNLCLNISISYKSYSPNDFRNTFCSKHIQYSNYGQHDTVELLRTLLDDISKELNTNEIISKYKELKTENKSKVEQNNEYHEWYLTRENSIIINIFYAQIINIFTCECGYESYSFEKILDIPLLLPNNRNSDKLNLEKLLLNYFSGEKFKWDSKCEKCLKKNLFHSKKILFSKLPKILVFSIQRYNYLSFGKSNKSVEFYDEIDLKNFIDNDLEINNNTKYKLFGISNHSGTLNFGHYYSYTKVNNCWFEFNDSFVSSKNISYNSTNVYALFYEQIID